MSKIIITCAVTGGAHTPTMSSALPCTPAEIAEQSISAAEAGAAILHLHARMPEDGKPTGDPEVYNQFLPVIKQRTDAIVNITTGGSATMPLVERLRAAVRFKPEMCSLNMGTINFAMFPAAKRISSWKHEWEKDYILGSDDFIFRNTFRDIATILETMGEAGTRFEHECYDVGHLYNLGKDSFQWSVLAAGKHQMPFLTQAALMGGHVRVGLEDSLFIDRGQLAVSNAQQVEKIVRIIREMGHEPATPVEARAMLNLKGGDRVEF